MQMMFGVFRHGLKTGNYQDIKQGGAEYTTLWSTAGVT